MAKKLQSTKLYNGFSTCFRQWKATDTHCKFLHGYAVSFRVTFEGELDHRNWIFDFGGMKRATNKIDSFNPEEYFKYLLDHTVIIAKDDPEINYFKLLAKNNVIQLRIVDHVGCEKFADLLIDKINSFLKLETGGRVQAVQLEFFENEKNSAIALRSFDYDKN